MCLADLHTSRNVNDKLSHKLVVLERKCHANEQYSRRERLEISGIPAEGIKTLKKVLEILDAIDAPVNTNLVEDCHRIPSKSSPKKVILKLSRREVSRRVLLNKKKLKQLKRESLNLPAGVKIYINESNVHNTKNYGQNARNCGMLSEFCHFGSVMDP